MVRRRFAGIAVLAGAALLGGQPASATAFFNGSFELGTDPLSTTHLNAGSTTITGWTIGGNSIDYVGSYWTAEDGSRSIDLSGTGAGNISQTFDTVVGQKYSVGFYLSGNPDAGPMTKTMRVSATGNTAEIFQFDATNSTHASMGWVPVTYYFTAKGASTTLRLASLNEGSAGAAIDNVTVTSVPEAASWAMMLGGFGVMGGVLRSRRRPGNQLA